MTRPLASRAAALLLVAALPGCMSVKYGLSGPVRATVVADHDEVAWQHSLFLGLIPVSQVKLDQLCPGESILGVRSQVGFLGGLATLVTLGLWTPTHVHVTCGHPVDPGGWAAPPQASAPPPALAVPAPALTVPGDYDAIVVERPDGTRVLVP